MTVLTLVQALLAAALLYLPVPVQPDLNGEWDVTIAAPRGALEYTMFLKQEGPRLSGYFQSQYGEIPLKGSIKGDAITLSWTMPEVNEAIDCTMTGTVNGDVISGEATLGKVGKGSFRAERTPS